MSSYAARKCLSAKALIDYIRSHPSGVTRYDIDTAGVSFWGMDILIRQKAVQCIQIPEKHRGPRCYKWFYIPTKGMKEIE